MIAVVDLLERTGRHAQARPAQLREVVLTHGADDYWVVECPSLPGCVSEGPSREAAIANAREAVAAHLTALQHEGLPVPPERFETQLLVLSV
jgi:predicted RNase H-like HicB family nuclease